MPESSALKLRDDVLNFVRGRGPVLPVHVGERFGFNTIIASAVLSDLTSQGFVRLSNAKIGGSPVYYSPGQEPKLQMLYKYLGEKPRRAYDLLRDSKVLRDKVLEPWQRVAVREIKDFSVMLRVNYAGNEEIFWKWYLVPDEEAKGIIAAVIKEDFSKAVEERQEKAEQVVENIQPPKEPEKIEKLPEPDPDPPRAEQKPVEEVMVREKRERPKRAKRSKSEPDFYGMVRKYFVGAKVDVLEEEVVRKNMEFNFVVNIPSSVGLLKFFVIAKNKKGISDSELSLAYNKGQLRKLPVLFLSSGEMSKKASSYLDANLKGYLSFKKLSS